MAALAKKPENRPHTCAAVLEGNDFSRKERKETGGPRSVAALGGACLPRPDGRVAAPLVGPRVPRDRPGGPRSVAALKGLVAAALLAALAGGAWWWASGREGTKGTKVTERTATANSAHVASVPSPTPSPPSAGSTESDVTDIAVEASVQKDRIARLDDADGFKEKKDEISGLLTRATSYGKAKRYKESAQAFSNYVAECRELVRLDVERKSALKDKAKAQEALQMAESSGAKTYAVSSWNTAVDVWRQASEQFGRMEFSQAGLTFSSSAELFGKCAEEVKAAKANEAATRIQKAESYLKSLQNSMADIEQVRATVATKTAPKNLPLRSRIGEAYDVYNKACMEMDRLRTIYTDLNPKVVGWTDVVNTAFSDMQNVIAQAQRSLTTIRQTSGALTALESDIFTFEFFKENLPQPLQDRLGDPYEAYCKACAEKRALSASYTEDHPKVAAASTRVDAALAAFKEALWAYKNGEQASTPKHPETYVVQAGDTLLGIAKRFYGSASKWRDIRDANMARVPPDGRLHVGLILKLPDVVTKATTTDVQQPPQNVQRQVYVDAHDKVQLWKGGPYWATTNIGAEKPEDYGYYFWWGDTKGYKREGNAWVVSDGSHSGFSFGKDTSSTYGKSIEALRNEGWITADGILAPEHDAAHVQWGGEWRMPTRQELDDLSSKCDWEWTTKNKVYGYEIRGRGAYASESIFLPAAGDGYGTSLGDAGSYGNYWSSVPCSDSSSYYDAWGLFFNSSYHNTYSNFRFSGQSVRPVQGFTK